MSNREKILQEEIHSNGEVPSDNKYSKMQSNQQGQSTSQDTQQSKWDRLKEVPFAGKKQQEQNYENEQEMEQGM